MKKLAITTAAALTALAAFCVWGEWVYEGQWGSPGTGNGEFRSPVRLALAAGTGDVYVADWRNLNVQYFTRAGSFLGKWDQRSRVALAFAPNRWRYQADVDNHRVEYFDENGSFRGKWGTQGPGEGEFNGPMGLAVARNGNVFVADTNNRRVQCFTYNGSFLDSWGSTDRPADVAVASSGKFYVAYSPDMGVAVAPDTGLVYVTDTENHRIQYYTAGGSLLGKIGSQGSGDGEFKQPSDVAFSLNGAHLYVTDTGNSRIQYFKYIKFAVSPASLGRVKALFN